nr:hypothetical protein [Tanacetum cinerariifolium]
IQARFGGNDATKKTQRTLLKQMYENFNAPSTESLDFIFNSTNKVETASIQVSVVSTPVSIVSSPDNTINLSDATVYAFLENQPNGSQLVYEDLEQIHEDDLEEMDLKWECKSPRNQESMPRNQDNSRKTMIVEDTSSKAMVAIDEAGFDWSYMADDEVPTNMALMAFSYSEDAKTLFEAIQARFGGNDATKKTQRTLLKQMYENFNAPSTESLDFIFNSTNKVETTSIQVSVVSTPVSIVSSPDNTVNLSDATVYAFLENQPNGSQLVYEDLEQIHEDDLEEMDLKW